MKTTILKNTALFVSGMILATSVSIFASNSGTSIDANLVNLQQYLKEFLVTSDGTPQGDQFLSINWEAGTMFASSGNFAFDFNSHNFTPFDYVWGVYNDGLWNILVNGIANSWLPIALISALSSDGDQIGISTRKQNGQLIAMMEYESTGNQDEAVQVQHQLRLQADGTTISFDDSNVLWLHSLLTFNGQWLNISTNGWQQVLSLARNGWFLQSNKELLFDIVNGYLSFMWNSLPFVWEAKEINNKMFINGILDISSVSPYRQTGSVVWAYDFSNGALLNGLIVDETDIRISSENMAIADSHISVAVNSWSIRLISNTGTSIEVTKDGAILLRNIPTFNDNTEASNNWLQTNALYSTPDGTLKIRY
jgi:hypothetical protein